MAYTLKLTKPVTAGGKELKELTFDFEKISAQSLIDAERTVLANNARVNWDMCQTFEFRLAALAYAAEDPGVNYATLNALHPKDAIVLVTQTAFFFVLGVLPTPEELENVLEETSSFLPEAPTPEPLNS
jgi:hypothetical protein